MYTITLANGKKLTGLDMNGTNYVSKEKVDETIFKDNLSTIFLSTPSGWRATAKTDKVFVCFCAKGKRICLFKTRKEGNLPVEF